MRRLAEMEEELVTIKNWGSPQYLDGATMQYAIYLGKPPNDHCVAFCDTLDVARVLANALGQTVIIQS